MVYPPCPVQSVYGGPAPATYVAPAPVPVPSCATTPDPATGEYFGADSAECQALLDKAEQARLAAGTAANYSVDLQNCLNTIPRPPDCYQRTFGLTLPGTTGGTNTLLANAQAILDPNYKGPVAAVDPHTGEPPVTKPATGGTTSKTPANGGATPPPSGDSPHELLYWTIGLGVLGILIAAVNR